ncbi:MAG: hypothetical protein RSE58_03165 [Clostridia bacterium]
MTDMDQAIELTLPAKRDYGLVARMAISGIGMLADLDVDLIADLRTVTDECLDCLTHQPFVPKRIAVRAWVHEKRLFCRFSALERECAQKAEALDLDIARGVLETLMPEVRLTTDEGGVACIECSMPV